MTLEEFYACIPNKEGIDTQYAKVVFERLVNLKKMMKQLPNEPFTLVSHSSFGSKVVKNPFYEILRTEESAVRMGLSELNITPKSRKMLKDADSFGVIPTLG